MKREWIRIGISAGLAAVLAAGCATAPKQHSAVPEETPSHRAEAPSGVEVLGLRTTAAGRLMDFRFRVVDPEKAGAVLNRRNAAYMVDEKTGARLTVPVTKVGSMRQTTMNPEKGRTYFIFFKFPGRQIESGDRFTVVMGKHRFENLTVQ